LPEYAAFITTVQLPVWFVILVLQVVNIYASRDLGRRIDRLESRVDRHLEQDTKL